TGLLLEDKFSIAAFHANDEQSLQQHWESIVSPTDLPRIMAIVRYFQPRFSIWWRQEGQDNAARLRYELTETFQTASLGPLLGSFVHFYGADVGGEQPL